MSPASPCFWHDSHRSATFLAPMFLHTPFMKWASVLLFSASFASLNNNSEQERGLRDGGRRGVHCFFERGHLLLGLLQKLLKDLLCELRLVVAELDQRVKLETHTTSQNRSRSTTMGSTCAMSRASSRGTWDLGKSLTPTSIFLGIFASEFSRFGKN